MASPTKADSSDTLSVPLFPLSMVGPPFPFLREQTFVRPDFFLPEGCLYSCSFFFFLLWRRGTRIVLSFRRYFSRVGFSEKHVFFLSPTGPVFLPYCACFLYFPWNSGLPPIGKGRNFLLSGRRSPSPLRSSALVLAVGSPSFRLFFMRPGVRLVVDHLPYTGPQIFLIGSLQVSAISRFFLFEKRGGSLPLPLFFVVREDPSAYNSTADDGASPLRSKSTPSLPFLRWTKSALSPSPDRLRGPSLCSRTRFLSGSGIRLFPFPLVAEVPSPLRQSSPLKE